MSMSMGVRGLALRSVSKTLFSQGVRCPSMVIGARYMSSTPEKQTDPKAKANSIINAIPGNNILTKTGVLGTSLPLSFMPFPMNCTLSTMKVFYC